MFGIKQSEKASLINFKGVKRPIWLAHEWQQLSENNGALDDEEFLRAFEPIGAGFEARRPYLEKCADVFERLVDKHEFKRGDYRVVEPASGCGVFTDILIRRGYRAIGLEAEDTITSRWCRLNGKEHLRPKNWLSKWSVDGHSVVVITGYITAPHSDYGVRATQSLVENMASLFRAGIGLLMLDYRYIDPCIERLQAMNIPFSLNKYRTLRGHVTGALFSAQGPEPPWISPGFLERLKLGRDLKQAKTLFG